MSLGPLARARPWRLRCTDETSWIQSTDAALLERFWKSRGVCNAEQRRALIRAARCRPQGPPLPKVDVHSGLAYSWNIKKRQQEVWPPLWGTGQPKLCRTDLPNLKSRRGTRCSARRRSRCGMDVLS